MMSCYYPTTTVAIDDDTDFLGILTQHFGIINCKPYSSPKKALQALNPHKTSFDRIRSRIIKPSSVSEDVNTSPEDHAVVFNMRGLHEEIYNKDRFHDVSVLIVDYCMDEISGIDLCEALSNHPAKKILLTGGADKEKVAIEAFHNGIIHRFINKSDPKFPEKLKQAISMLKYAYFNDLSSTLLPHISTIPTSLFHNTSYINFIRNIQEQFNSVEYYMLDTAGSIIMLDAQGEPSWFMLKQESEMNNYENLARSQEAPAHVIQGIADRSLMPFFVSEDDYQQPVSEWERFLYPTQRLPGIKNYYYSTYKGHRGNHVNTDKITSYASFCHSFIRSL